MAKQLELHSIQSEILVYLLLNPKVRFSKLNINKIPSDQFNFHLKRLIEENLIVKNSDGFYSLTVAGKEFANRFDTDNKKIERQAKVAVLICCSKVDGGKRKYLVQMRLKQPYYGFRGFMTGKIRWGETVIMAAERELMEETGLKGELKVVGVKHKMDYSKNGALLEDKFFFVIKVTNVSGNLVRVFEGGKNSWYVKEKILGLKNLFDGVAETMEMVEEENKYFIETKYQVRGY